MEGGGPAQREPHQEQQHATTDSTTQQQGGGGGGVITRRTPTPTCHHPLAAEMGLPLPGALGSLAAKEAESSAAAAAPARAEEGPQTDDVCAACRFGITGDEPAVHALRGLYHRECFRCHECGAALLPPGAPGPADAVARALRRVRLGSLDEADSEGETVEEEGEEDGNHLTFLQLGGLPLCREHFRARLLQQHQQHQQQEEDEATVPASPPTSGFATPDRPAPHQQQQFKSSPPASPAGSQQDGSSYVTATGATAAAIASAPSSPQVRFAPPVETQKARLPPIFHSADGLGRLEIPPPDVGDGNADAIERGGSEPSPTSLARLRRSKSATTLRSGGHGPHQRRGSHAHPLLSVAARETEAERDARLLRRRASQQELLFGGVGALSPPLSRGEVEGGEGRLSSPQRQQHQQPPPPPPRPLTTASALAYGVRVMRGGVEVEEETELEKGAFSERRLRELVYSCGAGEKPVSFFWEEAAPAVFARIRALFGVAPGAYAAALATLEEEDGRESGNTGKSGSRFLRPPRAESGAPVIVKSVSDEEAAFLLTILHDYLQVVLHRPTLLPRFLGLYRIKEPGKPPTRLLAQRNLFALPTPHFRLKERYDLKGSLIRRLAVAPPASENGGGGNSSGGGTPPSGSAAVRANGSSSGNGRARVPVQKDLAFCPNHDGTDDAGNGVKAAPGAACRVVRLGAERKKELLSFLAADVEWLRRRNVVDYSLLLGCASLQELNTNPWARRGGGGGASSFAALLPGAPDEESRHRLYSLWLPEHEPTTTTTPPGGASGTASPPISIFSTQDAFLMGLVDILQTFTLKRRLETVVKSGLASLEGTDPGGLSIVDPATYAQRLVSWVDNHTV